MPHPDDTHPQPGATPPHAAARPEQPAPPTGLVQIDPRLLAELQARLTALEAWRAHQSDLLDELLNPTDPPPPGPPPASRGRPRPVRTARRYPQAWTRAGLLRSRGRSTATR